MSSLRSVVGGVSFVFARGEKNKINCFQRARPSSSVPFNRSEAELMTAGNKLHRTINGVPIQSIRFM